ncbi:uroporphyrinogen-III synthase [Roseovarius sp. LXJ103]|uniref:uroporphyrinogen-III synthase n=1 Tax=Roseovarius carneus TaxID=2853164 RepID=UPI000D6174CC|nr:uroporphyrinogen-III synthase [Roseovarius carneus]MBZ8118501.1 uroporphyrinogen-III synthase [Roseovarius carneus]PWE35802.1 uroporphyrinogen-III synthase [Pelagicola sp. LXJ1103]
MAHTILITRPEPGGTRFEAQVRAQFSDVRTCLSPILEIVPEPDAVPIHGVRGLIFTSQYGVEQFAAQVARRDFPVFAVGGATGVVARAAGFGDVVEAEGDAVSLVAKIIEHGVLGPLLHLRGGVAAGDVAGDLTAAGIETRVAILYRQDEAAPTPEAKALLAGTAPVIVPLFSPRSAALWFAQSKPRAPLVIIAISEAVARAVPEGVAPMFVAHTPDAEAMLRLMPVAIAAAKRLEGAKGAQ